MGDTSIFTANGEIRSNLTVAYIFADGLIHNHLARCWCQVPSSTFYTLECFFLVILSLKLAPENGWLEDNWFPFGTWNLKKSPQFKRKSVWTEPTFVTLGLQHVNFPRVYRFFLMVLPLLDQQKASILLKSRQKNTNRRHGDRYVLWHNPWRVWVQKPLIGSSSQVWVWKDITNGDQEAQ